ncbi:hypothetical protein F511_21982 [Dorcoceras hygrometricum]|uniref:Uncharacterized protein n=1 Tax=Dorcoceras hygrometricum TaxID=472368 RepID=A0A2Z7CFF7_9LAMI|nr:hypothetical protein F511_21982 [Dorcoceras hygrometricum]
MEALRQIKVAVPTITRPKPNQIHSKRLRFPLSVSCSQSNINSTSTQAEEKGALLKSDWRAFRARLIAGERTQTAPKSPCPLADVFAPMGEPDPVEEKWAHPISEPEKGCLLIATEKLDSNHIYKRTVILVLSAGPTGLTGLILNRPSFMSVKEMKSWALNMSSPVSDGPLHFGGPLFEGLFLVNGKQKQSGVGVLDEVMKGLYYGTSESIDRAIETRRDMGEAGDFSFFDGYCGWESEELREEIRDGHWAVAACSPSIIGLRGAGNVGLWEEVNELMGHRKVC